ncbi:serine/threonine-protein kinase [Gammaproteobacteria bacterium AS21]
MPAIKHNTIRHFLFLLLCATLLLIIQLSPIGQYLSRLTYDVGVSLYKGSANNRISIIAIDEKSLANLGRWPWSREYHTALLDKLAAVNAKVVAFPIFFVEPQRDNRLVLLDNILKQPSLSELQLQIARLQSGAEQQQLSKQLSDFYLALLNSRQQFDVDAALSQQITKNDNVILAYHLGIGRQLGKADQELSPLIAQSVLAINNKEGALNHSDIIEAIAVTPPIPSLAQASSAMGHLATSVDSDGVLRRTPLVVDYYGKYLPSMALQIVTKALNLQPGDIGLDVGKAMTIGSLKIETDTAGQINNLFYPQSQGGSPFSVDSFYDVLVGNISADKFRNQIVLVGATAAGIGGSQVTATDSAMTPVSLLANTVSNLINEDFVALPDWQLHAQIVAYALVFVFSLFGLLLLPTIAAAIGSVLLFLVLVVGEIYLLASAKIWLSLTGPALFLALGYLCITFSQFLDTQRGKQNSDRDSAEGNRMLGLSFQGQGQLDIAFEKFQKCPLDKGMMQLLYNLGLDFERKRQFSKAAVVYQYMQSFELNYRDIVKRVEQAQKMDGAIVFGAPSQDGPGQSMVVDAQNIEKPMLGRYQIESELGKGAMGIVYKGRDPKIDRVVAIKTMALTQQFEESEIEDVKARFFREAETAGRLSHPNIVTVYDAGSEHDLAYIAMQFLPGYELTRHTKEGDLLALPLLLKVLIQATSALDYAHRERVVHRDIKPANIIYNPENESITVTDFGIARVTDASKTKTGTVLGTPSYMSPEQFRGEKSDGRADIFALGVTAYQLVTGELPFRGDSMASLMYAITSADFTAITELKPQAPAALQQILAKAMAKDRDERYLDAKQMQVALQEVLDAL